MHGLPVGFDPGVFVGRELEEVTFTINSIYVGLSGGVSITALNHLRYRIEGDDIDDVLPVTRSTVMGLLGKRVDRAEVRLPGDIVLVLEGGGVLLVEDDSKHYESYSVGLPSGELFV